MGQIDTARAHGFWLAAEVDCPEAFGVSPMGGGGLVEIAYRHYFELRTFRRQVSLTPCATVLELGAGTGRWMASLAPSVGHYTAVELNPAAAAELQAVADRRKLANVEVRTSAVESFKADRSYDLVYFSGVSQYIADDELRKTIVHLSEHLVPGAFVVDRSTINLSETEVMIDKDYTSVYRTPAQVSGLFSQAGLVLVHRCRSYRPLRFAGLLSRTRMSRLLLKATVLTRPLLFWALLATTAAVDTLRPRPFEGGRRSHDFMFFRGNKV